ncbi:MAG: patatin-like phospholipase family protein, partial [Oscillospiraceae bacterium]|nr:patatin-like phospholipase family protein [Oscillospiraceae bacterium]
GGSRGAYQIGVWKALRELGIDFHIVTGSSVGALNGALMVQGDFEAGLELWENISSKDVMTDILTEENLSTMKEAQVWRTFVRDVLEQGGCDITPLENTLRRLLDEPRFRSSPIDYALVTVEYPSLKPQELTKEQIPEGQVCDYLLASSACFPAFKIKEINGSKYIDGGYHDNLPMNLALKLGADEIIAVDLQSMGIIRKPKMDENKLTIIRSHWNLGPFILFDKTYARRNIALGYLDAMKVFGRFYGWKYAFLPEDCKTNARQLLTVLITTMVEARMNHLTFVNTLESTLYRSILKDFENLDIPEEKVTVGRILTRMAEHCGEIFHVDPTEVQQLSAFNSAVSSEFHRVYDSADLSQQGWGSIPKIIDELKNHDRMYICAYLYEQLQLLFRKDSTPKNLLLFVPSFPEELQAALYLTLLERRMKPYQWPELF